MTEPMIKRVTIVSACRNEAKHIAVFLNSLTMQDLADYEWEAIIADGMSTDGTWEALLEYSRHNPRIRAIRNHGLIASSGLNAAIREARGEIILRMDAHTVYADDYCQKCIETLLQTDADNVGGPARTKAIGAAARAVAAAYHSRFSTGGARFHDPAFEGWVDTVPYGCWYKDTLKRLGMFDEQLVRNQDDELNLRIVRAGGKIWQTPAIRSWYSPRSNIRALFNQYFQYGFWKVMVARKHHQTGSRRHFVPLIFVVVNVFLLMASLAALLFRAPGVAFAFAVSWLAMMTAYIVCCIVASFAAAREHGWQTLPYLPLIFAVFHISYGLGSLSGLATWSRSSTRPIDNSVFSRITR
jgi:glycosyltransferase involved in cell wall biosynthesis